MASAAHKNRKRVPRGSSRGGQYVASPLPSDVESDIPSLDDFEFITEIQDEFILERTNPEGPTVRLRLTNGKDGWHPDTTVASSPAGLLFRGGLEHSDYVNIVNGIMIENILCEILNTYPIRSEQVVHNAYPSGETYAMYYSGSDSYVNEVRSVWLMSNLLIAEETLRFRHMHASNPPRYISDKILKYNPHPERDLISRRGTMNHDAAITYFKNIATLIPPSPSPVPSAWTMGFDIIKDICDKEDSAQLRAGTSRDINYGDLIVNAEFLSDLYTKCEYLEHRLEVAPLQKGPVLPALVAQYQVMGRDKQRFSDWVDAETSSRIPNVATDYESLHRMFLDIRDNRWADTDDMAVVLSVLYNKMKSPKYNVAHSIVTRKWRPTGDDDADIPIEYSTRKGIEITHPELKPLMRAYRKQHTAK